MAHKRLRLLKQNFLKHTKVWPVVSLLGPRQCGKSTFLRDLTWPKDTFTYLTLDNASTRRRAIENPELFLSESERLPFVVDEIQKAPELFDEIKAVVDQKRVPGRFILSGSVQFSRKIGIRESLTGRTATLYLDTLTLRESSQVKTLELKHIQQYMKLGGMPGVCFFRDSKIRTDYWEQWLETLCERDLKTFSKGRLSGDLARRILEQCATLQLPMIQNIAKNTRIDARRIQTHIDALVDLFIVRPIQPHAGSTGKTIYIPFDCGLSSHLGAGMNRLWQVWFLVEWYNQRAFNFKQTVHPQFYLTSRHSFVDFVTENTGHLFCGEPSPSRSYLMTAQAAAKKLSNKPFIIHCATNQSSHSVNKGIQALPWPQLTHFIDKTH